MENLETYTNLLVALGTLSLAILVVYDDVLKFKLLGPKLNIKLEDNPDKIFEIDNKNELITYHLYIWNTKKHTLARNVNILLNRVQVKQCGQLDFSNLLMSGPMPLYWQWSDIGDPYFKTSPTLGPGRFCDLFNLKKERGYLLFTTTLEKYPNTRIQLYPNDTARIEIVVYADNAKPKYYYLEITWNGAWPKKNNIHTYLDVKEIDYFNDVMSNISKKDLKK